MKKINIFLFSLIATLFSMACTSNDDLIIKNSDLETGNTSVQLLQPETGGAYVISSGSATSIWETFTWEAANTASLTPDKYEIELAKEGSDFSESAFIGPFTADSAEVTADELNTAIGTLGFTAADMEAKLTLRIKETIGDNFYYYSEPIMITVAGFWESAIQYNLLYAVGSFNGWTNEAAKGAYQLFTLDPTQDYKGYIDADAAAEFKIITTLGDWNNGVYGSDDGTPSTAGTLNPTGGGNIASSGDAGPYLLSVNTTTNTWTLTPTLEFTANNGTWGVTGEMNSWGENILMTYNTTNGLLELTTDLIGGVGEGKGFKFRQDNTWDVAYGTAGIAGVADPSGDNISVPNDGTYLIQLDLRNPDQISYTLTPQ